MDQAFLRPLPGMVLMAPSDECELNRALRFALTLDTPSAIRYPRDVVPPANLHETIDEPLRRQASGEWELARGRVLREGRNAVILCYGALAPNALAAADELAGEGLAVGVVDARFCKPIDGRMIECAIAGGSAVLTLEDHSLQNGFGSAVLEYAVSRNMPTDRITRLGMPDRLIAHATRQQQLAEVGLDPAGIARSVRDAVRRVSATVRHGVA
jgi:1-deoxy-D-xylulose-5-phosphate synthase